MKYMLLIYETPDTREIFTGAEGRELMAQVNAIVREITDSGELVGGEALADPSTAKSVRTGSGSPAVTDGPCAAAKEHLGGYVIVECDHARALDIASRWPAVGSGGMEVRALMDGGGAEMGAGRAGPVTMASRTCCARSRRRCSARSCAGTGSSTRARTRPRRR